MTSTTPCLVTVVPMALKRLSATGSIMYFINSLTDTTGFRSPQSTPFCGIALVCAGFGAGVDEEHAARVTLTKSTPPRVRRCIELHMGSEHHIVLWGYDDLCSARSFWRRFASALTAGPSARHSASFTSRL